MPSSPASTPVLTTPVPGPAVAAGARPRGVWPRRALGVAAAAAAVAGLTVAARALAPVAAAPAGLAASVACGAAAMVLLGSLVEWWVHGRLMHRPSRWPVLRQAYALHHRAHHWTHYPPDRYLRDAVTYVPLGRPERVHRTRAEAAGAVLGQVAFYGVFAAPIVAGAWTATGNAPFVAAVIAVAAGIIGLAVHVHDAVHCPGHSPLERFGWFWFLDRHHFVHHIDTRANVNFLLPLGDWLLGTLRTELTAAEAARWPSYAAARSVVHPARAEEGAKGV